MKVVNKYWPRLVHIGLGDIGRLIGHVFESCNLQRAHEIKFYHVWTHADPLRPVLDQVCGSNLALMPYSPTPFDEWIKQFKMRVEARPRIMLVDRSIGAHPSDQDIPSRVATGYGVDSALLVIYFGHQSACVTSGVAKTDSAVSIRRDSSKPMFRPILLQNFARWSSVKPSVARAAAGGA